MMPFNAALKTKKKTIFTDNTGIGHISAIMY